MKLLKLTLLLTILLQGGSAFLAQNVTDSKGLKQGEWRKLNADGKLVYEGRFKDNIPQVHSLTFRGWKSGRNSHIPIMESRRWVLISIRTERKWLRGRIHRN